MTLFDVKMQFQLDNFILKEQMYMRKQLSLVV